MGHLQPLDFVIIILYALAVITIGWWYSRSQQSTEEYFVGSRSMGSLVAGLSIIATLVSSISYLATPGEMVKNGPGWMWQMLHAPITFAVVGYLIIPRIMQHRVTSGYQLLEERFGMRVRQAAATMFILARFFWMGLVIYTCSFAVATVTGINLRLILIAVGVVGTAYTILGGIRAVMITDGIQFVVLIGGALLTIAFVSVKCGGITAWWPDFSSPQLAELQWPKVKLMSINPFDRLSALSVIIYGCSYWILTATGDQVVIQRFLSTRDAKSARRSFAVSLVGDWCTSLVLFATGMALVGFYLRFPEQLPDSALAIPAQADELFPHFIAAVLPAGLTGLVVSALFAAAMSSLDSGISSISTVLLTDFEAVFAPGGMDDRQRLRRARVVGLGIGVAAIAVSFGVMLVPGSNLLEVTVRVSSLLAAPLFVAFILAFYAKSSTPAGAWAAIAVGIVTGVGLTYSQQIVALLTGTEQAISITLIMPISTLCAFLTGVVVSQFTTPIAGRPSA